MVALVSVAQSELSLSNAAMISSTVLNLKHLDPACQ
jgi:hypothetical protein